MTPPASTLRIRLAAGVLRPIRTLSRAARWLSAWTHRLQYKAQGALLGDAEWFDHEIDVHWQWPHHGSGAFLERGAFIALGMQRGDRVLELCSGDGFYAARFYAPRVASVLALDHDPAAVRFAQRAHRAANVSFQAADITRGLPPGPFERVVWNAALTHFTIDEIDDIVAEARLALAPGGLLAGHTGIEPDSDYVYSRYALRDAGDLAGLLTPHFAHVAVLESPDATRLNLYFLASDDRSAIFVSEEHPAVTYWPGGQPTGRFARVAQDPIAEGRVAGL
jgi:SAM-dependent methyltransferase